MLAINNLQRDIGKARILKGITAKVNAGDTIALLGKNGSGKTTLLETLLGFAAPSAGEVELWGCKATAITADIKQRIGFVPQQNELLLNLTAKETLSLFKSFRASWNSALVDRLTSEWMIPMDMRVGKMSLGQQQKLSILLAMAHEPDLLVLDEPVASLDPIARRQFLQHLIEVASDENRSIIFSTHIISDVERVANSVWMMRDGALTYQGELDALKESIARITITAAEPVAISLPNSISQRLYGNKTVITLASWREDMQQEIAQRFCAQVSVEHLGLEDIFLEMNA